MILSLKKFDGKFVAWMMALRKILIFLVRMPNSINHFVYVTIIIKYYLVVQTNLYVPMYTINNGNCGSIINIPVVLYLSVKIFIQYGG